MDSIEPTWMCLELHLDCLLLGWLLWIFHLAKRCGQKRSFQRNLIPVSCLSLYCFPIIFITNDSCFQCFLFQRILISFCPYYYHYFLFHCQDDSRFGYPFVFADRLAMTSNSSACSSQESAISIIIYRHDIPVQWHTRKVFTLIQYLDIPFAQWAARIRTSVKQATSCTIGSSRDSVNIVKQQPVELDP